MADRSDRKGRCALARLHARTVRATCQDRRQVLAEDPTSAPSPGLVAEANAPCRCAYLPNGRLHSSRETERACWHRSAGDRDGLVQPYQPASNFQLCCESWQVVPGVASGCTRVFLPAPSEQQMFGTDHRRAKLARLGARKGNDSPRFLRCTAQPSATPPLQPSGCSASNTNIPAHRSQRSRFPRTPAWVV